MSSFAQQLVNGLMIGCLYALIAVAYTMVYGIIELINFAFGELFMFGAFITIMMMSASITLFGRTVAMPHLNFFLAILIAMAVVGVMGVVIERLAYRPLRNAPRLAALISAIGVSVLLQNVAQAIYGSDQVPFPNIPLFTTSGGEPKAFALGGVQITYFQVFVVIVTVAVMVLLTLYVRRTRMGRAMRASAQDKSTSALMGVNVNKVIALTFLIGSSMGALAGALYGGVYHAAWPLMGFTPGLKAFIAAVLGGIGNIPGAFMGGIEVFGREPLYNDAAEICTGVLVTYGVAGNPLLALAALPVVTLLQRSLRHVQLVNDSRADSKTGLLNAATWEREATVEVGRAVRTRTPLAVAILDIDRFKVINDTYGHLVGDQVLKEIARTLDSLLRDYDRAGRFGGEEFSLLLPQTRAVDAFRIAERVRANIAGLSIIVPGATGGERVHVTVSDWGGRAG